MCRTQEEDRQRALFPDAVEAWEREWNGMPEFHQENHAPYQTINVHFQTPEDVAAFARLVAQTVSPTTRGIWFPARPKMVRADLRWADEP